jgi:hypothetical protein
MRSGLFEIARGKVAKFLPDAPHREAAMNRAHAQTWLTLGWKNPDQG